MCRLPPPSSPLAISPQKLFASMTLHLMESAPAGYTHESSTALCQAVCREEKLDPSKPDQVKQALIQLHAHDPARLATQIAQHGGFETSVINQELRGLEERVRCGAGGGRGRGGAQPSPIQVHISVCGINILINIYDK